MAITKSPVGELKEDFFTFVYKYHESTHSGVLSNLLRLDLQYPHSIQQRTEALLKIANYAHYSIMAYRAIQWWASQKQVFEVWILKDIDSTVPIEILKKIEKPKEYLSINSKMESVPDDTH